MRIIEPSRSGSETEGCASLLGAPPVELPKTVTVIRLRHQPIERIEQQPDPVSPSQVDK
jgi:hypothetical protein